MGKSSTYIYDAGESDRLRLKLLNKIYNPNSFLKLKEVLTHRKVIVDMGCGQGDITCWLSQHADNDAIIVAVDVDSEQLNIARNKAERIGAQNILFIECPVQDFTLDSLIAHEIPKVDLIFSRWLLIHLAKNEITKAISNMKSMLSADGLLITEEVDLSISHHHKEPSAYTQYKHLFSRLASNIGIDFDLGNKLQKFLENLNMDILRQSTSDPIFNHDDLLFFIIDLKSSVELFTKHNIATSEDIESLCSQLNMVNLRELQKIKMTNILTISSLKE